MSERSVLAGAQSAPVGDSGLFPVVCSDGQTSLHFGPARWAVLQWPRPPALSTAAPVVYKDQLAEMLATLPVEKMVRSQVYLSTRQMSQLYRLAAHQIVGRQLHGVGIELGAGCALLSAVVARSVAVKKVYAVEVCGKYATLVMPRVARHVLGRNAGKVLPVIGSFDDLRLPDASLDFAVEIDSFHHSDDLGKTLSECARVLKPGGQVLCVDRCHPDSVTDTEVRRMLSRVYSRDYLVANNYPPDICLTRGENGEHEYRQREWLKAFRQAGLKLVRQAELTRSPGRRAAVRGLFAWTLLPGCAFRNTWAWITCFIESRTSRIRCSSLFAARTGTVFLLVKP